jgi:23S rRNA pseudouridine1911/1915/1917 synthase
MSTETVPPELDGDRLDLIVSRLAGLSRSRARALVDAGGVQVGGRRGTANERLPAGTRLVIGPAPPARRLEPAPVEFTVRFEDPDLVVVDKPPRLVVHPGAGVSGPTLAAGLLHRYPEIDGVGEEGRWGIVHRLDRDTSGLLVVARTEAAHAGLQSAIAHRQVVRVYRALALGSFELPTGTIDAPIGSDPARPTRRRVDPAGRPARTHYRVVRAWTRPACALLEVRLETGRTHQIRVHLASIGHPVVGDRVYGRPGAVDAPRIFLHASRIELDHPVTAERLVVESPLPDDLAAVVERLEAGV